MYHFWLHTASLITIVLGVTAAYKSHTLKRPTPIPNFYSVHSWLGVATLALLVLQYLLAAGAFLWPRLPPAQRRQLSPLHMYLGRAVFVSGLATMAVRWQLLVAAAAAAAGVCPFKYVNPPKSQQCSCSPTSWRRSAFRRSKRLFKRLGTLRASTSPSCACLPCWWC